MRKTKCKEEVIPLEPNLIAFLFLIHILILEKFDYEYTEIRKIKSKMAFIHK